MYRLYINTCITLEFQKKHTEHKTQMASNTLNVFAIAAPYAAFAGRNKCYLELNDIGCDAIADNTSIKECICDAQNVLRVSYINCTRMRNAHMCITKIDNKIQKYKYL